MIYEEKTDRARPEVWDITYNKNHWSTEALVIQDTEEITIPYVEELRALAGKPALEAILLLGMFKPNQTLELRRLCKDNGIKRKLIPPGTTDEMQPELKEKHIGWLEKVINNIPEKNIKKQWEACGYYKAYDTIQRFCAAPVFRPRILPKRTVINVRATYLQAVVL